MEISFKNKRAIVTGGAQGIGRGIAEALLKYGSTVTVLDKNQKELDKLKSECPNINVAAVDLCDWNSVENVLKDILPADLLVNNAGVACTASVPNITKEQFNRTFGTNVGATINMTRIFAKDVIEREAQGSIVNISSQAAIAGLLHRGVYCASKGAIDAFTRAAAIEFGPRNIRINCVNPTVVLTELGRTVWKDPVARQGMLDKIPLKRFAEVEDIANAVLFLLSDKASMIHGVCLPIDGGFTAS